MGWNMILFMKVIHCFAYSNLEKIPRLGGSNSKLSKILICRPHICKWNFGASDKVGFCKHFSTFRKIFWLFIVCRKTRISHYRCFYPWSNYFMPVYSSVGLMHLIVRPYVLRSASHVHFGAEFLNLSTYNKYVHIFWSAGKLPKKF
jgi:hypothetical protein